VSSALTEWPLAPVGHARANKSARSTSVGSSSRGKCVPTYLYHYHNGSGDGRSTGRMCCTWIRDLGGLVDCKILIKMASSSNIVQNSLLVVVSVVVEATILYVPYCPLDHNISITRVLLYSSLINLTYPLYFCITLSSCMRDTGAVVDCTIPIKMASSTNILQNSLISVQFLSCLLH
jgi:hypothetical protein